MKYIRKLFIIQWVGLSIKEIMVQFSFGKAPEGRDFIWLSIFLCLLMTSALLFNASKEGLSERIVELLLGRVPGHGIPIWVRDNPYKIRGRNQIDQYIVKQVDEFGKSGAFHKIKMFPYRDIDKGTINLPGENLWKDKEENISIPFNGMGVYRDDPLWRYALTKNSTNSEENPSLTIVLSRLLFKKCFNYNAYMKCIKTCLPPPIYNKIPNEDLFYDSKETQIWIRINGTQKDVLKAKVLWIERVPIPGKYAFLFPMDVYHALSEIPNASEMHYFPEFNLGTNGGKRAKNIILTRDIPKIEAFAECLKGKVSIFRNTPIVDIEDYPAPVFWIDACAKSLSIDQESYKIADPLEGDSIKVDRWTISLPTEKLPEKDSQNTKSSDGFSNLKIEGFIRSFVYVQDRNDIADVVSAIKKMEGQPLRIPWIYSDAIQRFSVLIEIFDLLSRPYTLLFIIIFMALIWVQMGTLIGHRRHHYGIFFAKGMYKRYIYYMLYFQTFISSTMGIIGSGLILFFIRWYMNSKLISIALKYKDVITIDKPDLLPLTFVQFFGVYIAGILSTWLIVSIILCVMPLRPGTMPADLIKE